MAAACQAQIWRATRGEGDRQARPPPSFAWTPSRKSLDAALDRVVGMRGSGTPGRIFLPQLHC
eukprot:6677835-Pyramimonas_sp.AAC.1